MFTIYTSDAYQQESNCVYPHPVQVVDEASFKRAVSHDHVCAKYRNNYRGNQNFISSDCLPVDCDNDHSDDPAGWKTPADIRKALPGVFFAVHYSRHNNRPKDGKSARPRFHLFFQIDPMTDYEAYAALKQLLHEIFPYLDANALDAARFLYGTRDPKVEFHPGGKTLTDFLYGDEFDKDMPGGYEKQATIPEGSRNTTMFRWAVRSMKRYGDTEESKNAYFTEAEKCQPPLSTDELNHIWKSAQKYYAKIASQPGYVSPQEYNNPNPGWDEPLPFSRYTMAPFPVDALPEPIANYVKAVAESTQTSVDMAGSIAISVLSTCLQKKYRIQGKSDWVEPLNTYVIVIAPPSERKSSVLHLMLQPVNDYEVEYNKTNAAAVEAGRMQKRVLERRQKALEEKVAKGTADPEELERIAQEVADFEETNPLQLYVDDITTEKLVSVIASNHGHASLISSEGGIFDTLSGIYTRNVNIDVMLKGYSGDKLAFGAMMNKLIAAHRLILKPYAESLKRSSTSQTLSRIQHLETGLAENADKRKTLTKLMAQGFIDQVIYSQQTAELLSQADDIRKQIDALKNTTSNEATVLVQAEDLLRFTEKSPMLEAFDDQLFTRFVERIVIRSRHEAVFHLKCGLTLTERM